MDAPCKAVTAANSTGSIRIKGAAGPLKLSTTSAGIDVDANGAEVEATAASGAIKIKGAKGKVTAKTSFAPMAIEAVDAVVHAENSTGSIQFTGGLAAGKHLFKATSGGVTLTLPAKATFALDAQTTFGKVTCRFPLQTTTAKESQLVGSIGENPPVHVTVRASSGDVEIRKGK